MEWQDLFRHEMEYPPAPVVGQGAGAAPAHATGEAVDETQPEATPQFDDEAIARAFPGGGGVYLLTDEQDRLVQLSAAADLRRALRGRLLEPVAETGEPVSATSRRRARLGEIVRKIRWLPAHSMFEIDYAYLRVARRVLPDDYLRNLAFGPAWFVHVDPAAAIPRFVSSKVLRPEPGTHLGPFMSQADANRFIGILEDAFDLCRCYDSLGQAPHGTTCAYYEMGKCPAPCQGLIPMEQYRGTIAAALGFARGQRETAYEAWREQMRALAAERAFERAAAVKQRIERAEAIDQPCFRQVGTIEEFNYLVLQRGQGRTWVKPFLVRRGSILAGDPVRLKAVDQAIPQWFAAMGELPAAPQEAGPNLADDLQFRSEQVWLVSHYLFKREPPGLFLRASELDDPSRLVERVQARFGATSRQSAEDRADGGGPAVS